MRDPAEHFAKIDQKADPDALKLLSKLIAANFRGIRSVAPQAWLAEILARIPRPQDQPDQQVATMEEPMAAVRPDAYEYLNTALSSAILAGIRDCLSSA